MTEPERRNARLCTVCIPLRWTKKQREQGEGPNPYPVEFGYACPSCRVALTALLNDIAESYGWLGWALLRPESGKRGDGRATSPDPALPFSVEAHDLLADHAVPEGPLALARLNENADVQVGHRSVRSTLGTWVRDWIAVRDVGENGPESTVDAMTGWLAARTDWAADHHPALDEYADEMAQLRGLLFALVGRPEPDERPQRLPGVPCPRCRHVSLVRRPLDLAVECSWPDCRSVWTPAEYERVTKAVAGAVRRGQIELP